MTYRKMRIIVGFFVISITLIMGGAVYFLLENKGAFNKSYSFHFQTQSAASFNIGMPLKYSGFDIGILDEIELNDDGTVRMRFTVNEKNRKWITKYSVLMLVKPLIGSSHIVLYSAMGNDLLPKNASLEIVLTDDINDMITKLQPTVERIIGIIKNIDKIIITISKEDSDLMMIMKNINLFTQKLSKNDSLLTTLTGSKSSTNDVISSLKSLEKIMLNMQDITNHVDTDIVTPTSSAIKELDLILKDVKSKLEKLDGTVDSVGSYGEDLVLIKEQVSVGIQKSNQLMDKMDSIMQDDSDDEVVLP